MKKYYEGRQIIQREEDEEGIIEYYISFKNGVVYLEKYTEYIIDKIYVIAICENK